MKSDSDGILNFIIFSSMNSFESPFANNKSNVEASTARSVEAQANFEGNETLLLLERLSDKEVKDQIVDLLFAAYKHHEINAEFESREEFFVAPTRSKVREDLEKRMQAANKKTNITYDKEAMPNEDVMPLNWCMPWGGDLSSKNQSIMEAHEKGHKIRPYFDEEVREACQQYFRQGFDLEAVEFGWDYYQYFLDNTDHKDIASGGEMTHDTFKKKAYDYLFNGAELVERMSQIKNYFGMRGDEEFTKDHLEYARENYIDDTNHNNEMDKFFEAITKKTADEFIRLMNEGGI